MKCPGQDMQYWTSEAIYEEKCPQCGSKVEFYKDDTSRKCRNCDHRFVNPKMDFGCAAYCQFAEQCLGTLPEEFLAQRDNLLKDRVAVETKRYLKTDFKRISQSSKIARYAERIGKAETGNLAVVLCASYLLHVGDSQKNDKKGITVAHEILTRLGADDTLISSVCQIIDHSRNPGEDESKEFDIVFDADLIAELEECHKSTALELAGLTAFFERTRTKGGRLEMEALARKLGISHQG